MSTTNTASIYISKIVETYPVAGQDNSTSGFRNNFKNIKTALTYADQDIYDLKTSSVRTTQSNNFNNNIIKKATFQECATLIYDKTDISQPGDIVIDYQNGSYQKFKVSTGYHTFTIINWPTSSKSGSLTVSVISDSLAGVSIGFSAPTLVNLGTNVFPQALTNGQAQLFELWTDGTSGVVYIKNLNSDSAFNSTATSEVDLLILGKTNTYKTGTNVTNAYATVITANGKAANLALVPNRITVTTTAAPVLDMLGDTTASTFAVSTTSGIMIGAKVDFANSTSTTSFTVVSFTNNTVSLDPPFEVTAFNIGDSVTFTNPQFTNQPTVLRLKPEPVTTTTSVITDLKGQVYVSSTTLYVAYDDYSKNKTTWLKISGDHVDRNISGGSTVPTQLVANSSSLIANTQFVHNILPYGSIILWYGSVATIPTGWALCNGSNGTPDLRNLFVVGAGSTYAVGDTGGSANAVVVSHTHSASSSVTDPGHSHRLPSDSSGTTDVQSVNETSEANEGFNISSEPSVTGITVATTVNSTGVSGIDANLPPYYALCYIMKTSGATS